MATPDGILGMSSLVLTLVVVLVCALFGAMRLVCLLDTPSVLCLGGGLERRLAVM